MSEVKVNKITPRTNCGTTTLGDSGDTFNIPAGVTISNNGTATGFGATGAVNWDVSSIKTVTFTATAGVGYFVDTATTGAVIVNLPAGTAGDVIGVADYAKNFNSASCTLAPNGTEKIAGTAIDSVLETKGLAVTLVYVDASKGWIVTDSGNASDAPTEKYVAASGGCITTCGDYKVHTFLSPGTFTVSCGGNAGGSNTVDYMIVAGGGGSQNAGCGGSGGGGAGGWRASSGTASGSYTAGPGPLTSPVSAAPVSASPGSYAVVVGGGGAAGNPGPSGTPGVASSFACITSAGGGRPSSAVPLSAGSSDGGSGGGGGSLPVGSVVQDKGAGNTPPVSPPQGMPGGDGNSTGSGPSASYAGGGGGGATTAGADGAVGPVGGGVGGSGATSCISFSPVTYAGGGGGGTGMEPGGINSPEGAGGPGGGGGGGRGVSCGQGTNGTTNTGGGAGGGGYPSSYTTAGAQGGSGIVIIRYKYK